ncbi:uncharacterized protein C2845_PM12G10720 [Panicum miliaceum]|uniref:BRO1 domain-containing protein n=1 Tax=Panicum miliaceum TaxID=4540 RepID=A0A3L6QBT8_PANMI|nr:uncharacterized protein C2845_PM12G10720 [Panicum miliaceum]
MGRGPGHGQVRRASRVQASDFDLGIAHLCKWLKDEPKIGSIHGLWGIEMEGSWCTPEKPVEYRRERSGEADSSEGKGCGNGDAGISNCPEAKAKGCDAHGGSRTANLLQALEEYLPALIGLAKEGSELRNKVQFVWANQEDVAEETSMADPWYEVLSVLHLMAMVCFVQANTLLLPRSYADGHGPRVSEESRRELPVDLAEGNLKALSLQGLSQGVDMPLGLAIDNPKATLAVKRRLACEMTKCWKQAAAYYFHGLILDEGETEKAQEMAIAALQASEEFLNESKIASEAFHAAPPASRSPSPFGTTKYLLDRISKDVQSKVQSYQDLYTQQRAANIGVSKIIATPPPLPDFPLALSPEDYELPQLDPLWKGASGLLESLF